MGGELHEDVGGDLHATRVEAASQLLKSAAQFLQSAAQFLKSTAADFKNCNAVFKNCSAVFIICSAVSGNLHCRFVVLPAESEYLVPNLQRSFSNLQLQILKTAAQFSKTAAQFFKSAAQFLKSAPAECVAARVICTVPVSNQHVLVWNLCVPASDRQEGSLCYPKHIHKGGRFGTPVVCTSQRRGVRAGVGWRITCSQIHPPVRSQMARPSQLCKCSDLGLTSAYVALMDGLIMW